MVESIVSVVVVGALVQVIKQTDKVKSNYLPLLAVVVGVLLGLAESYVNTGYAVSGALGGIMVGLASSGLYDNAKLPLSKLKKIK